MLTPENHIEKSRHQVPFHWIQFRPKNSRWAIIIPVFNEGERIQHQLEKMQPLAASYDILLVDGGSTDGSISDSFLRLKNVTGCLRLSRPGLGNQLNAIFKMVSEFRYKGVICIDGNDKDDTNAIPRIAKELENGMDLVQGSRFLPGGHHLYTPFERWFAIRFIHTPIVNFASGFRFTDTTNGLKGLSARYLKTVISLYDRRRHHGYGYHCLINLVAPGLNMRVCELPVSRCYPASGIVPSKIQCTRHKLKMLWDLLKEAYFVWTERDANRSSPLTSETDSEPRQPYRT